MIKTRQGSDRSAPIRRGVSSPYDHVKNAMERVTLYVSAEVGDKMKHGPACSVVYWLLVDAICGGGPFSEWLHGA